MIQKERITQIGKALYKEGAVLCILSRDLRAHDNDALLFAQSLALEKGVPLLVEYPIWNYVWEGATRRFYDWVIPSLQEMEESLRSLGIPLIVSFIEKNKQYTLPFKGVGAVVIDTTPLRFHKAWKHELVHSYGSIPLYEVDAHNIVPVPITSPKQEFAARTIRGKLYPLLPQYLTTYSLLKSHTPSLCDTYKPVDWKGISSSVVCDESVHGTGKYTPGSKAGEAMLDYFLKHKLDAYDEARNDFGLDGQSNLSPYIAHGNISRRTVVLTTLKHKETSIDRVLHKERNGSNGKEGSVSAFLEETIVRAELSENFCYYNDTYATYEGFPEWAKKNFEVHKEDGRDYVYSYEAFRDGKTHDPIWNAAQTQLVKEGKMHGYLRMYWAKKILEWTNSPEEAMRTAVRLNDVYELDGRDPNGYVGCAWSIGGLHDRPWFVRPVYGSIRYMAESGARKHGNIDSFVEHYIGSPRLL